MRLETICGLYRAAETAAVSFGHDRRGAITPFLLAIFLGLVLITGLGIDLARHESARAALQDALDRGVLSAAQSTDNPVITVRSFVEERQITGDTGFARVDVKATDTRDGRYRVAARAEDEVDTIFARMLGIDRVPVVVEAVASEARPKLELALALDISSSMGGDAGLAPLRAATAEFSEEMLRAAGGRETTITLVPFAGSVNPGYKMFRALGGFQAHEISFCLDLPSGDFSRFGLPAARDYAQVPAFMAWPRAGRIRLGDAGTGWCPGNPEYDYLDPISGQAMGYLVGLRSGREKVMTKGAVIAPHASDMEVIERRLAAMRQHHGTSPQEGLKWALAMLDPATRPMLEAQKAILGDRPGRPLPLDRPNGAKVVVMVTDGRISEAVRPDWDIDGRRSLLDKGPHLLDRMVIRNARGYLLEQCRIAAEQGIDLYIVGVSLPGRAISTYRHCLGDHADSRLLLTDRQGLSSAYRYIRRRLTDLRLER
ncbi:MAG: pilus assembly protein TadG-related protein [Pseudomonadota bacterium]